MTSVTIIDISYKSENSYSIRDSSGRGKNSDSSDSSDSSASSDSSDSSASSDSSDSSDSSASIDSIRPTYCLWSSFSVFSTAARVWSSDTAMAAWSTLG